MDIKIWIALDVMFALAGISLTVATSPMVGIIQDPGLAAYVFGFIGLPSIMLSFALGGEIHQFVRAYGLD